MKIVRISNHGDETFPEVLVCENVLDGVAATMLTALQDEAGDDGPVWYTFKPDDYVLWRGMHDLVGEG